MIEFPGFQTLVEEELQQLVLVGTRRRFRANREGWQTETVSMGAERGRAISCQMGTMGMRLLR